MPDFDVFIEAEGFVLDKTRQALRVAFPGNPVTAATAEDAITAAATQLAQQMSPQRAEATYVAQPAATAVRKVVTFDPVPVLSDPPHAAVVGPPVPIVPGS